jgi:hypothetical protein
MRKAMTLATKMVDKQVQSACSVETLLNIANSSNAPNCRNCAELELQLLQALNELSSVQLIVDLLNKEHKHKQDEPTLDIIRSDQWTRVSSNKA